MQLAENICRACLQTEDFARLHDWNLPMQELDEDITCVECFRRCTRLDVNMLSVQEETGDASCSEFLCDKCCNDLRIAYKFLVKSEASDYALRSLYGSIVPHVKVEPKEEVVSQSSLETQLNFSTRKPSHTVTFAENLPGKAGKHNNESADSDQENPSRLNVKGTDIGTKPHFNIKLKSCLRKKDTGGKKMNKMNKPSENKLIKNTSKRSKIAAANPDKNKTNAKKDTERKNNKISNLDIETTCEFCAKAMPIGKLKRHVSQCHGPKPELLCYACPRIFNDSGSLHRHEAIHKDRERKYKCKLCEQSFFNKLDSQRHMKTHEADRKPQYACDLCEKAFLHKGSLKSHHLFHTGPLYECPLCPKRYVRAQDLQKHKRSHSGEMPYKCTKCDKSFALNHTLTMHMRKHDGVRYKCEVCGKEYTNGSTLSGHRKEHTGMPRKCSICEKGFATRSKTLRHIQHVHKISNPEEMEKFLVEIKLQTVRKRRLIAPAPENLLDASGNLN